MALPEWLPPSFRGVSARYGHMLKATISFSGSPAAMQQLTKHLSLEGSRRGSVGSLLRLESQQRKSRPGVQGRGKGEPPAVQVASAKVPILVLPSQVSFRSKKPEWAWPRTSRLANQSLETPQHCIVIISTLFSQSLLTSEPACTVTHISAC